jgi:hypothetical protein
VVLLIWNFVLFIWFCIKYCLIFKTTDDKPIIRHFADLGKNLTTIKKLWRYDLLKNRGYSMDPRASKDDLDQFEKSQAFLTWHDIYFPSIIAMGLGLLSTGLLIFKVWQLNS